jgi:hypothetical protein
MADRYIDQYEVLGYGAFSSNQLREMVLPLDPVFAVPVQFFITTLDGHVQRMSKLLGQAGLINKITYKGVEGTEHDHLSEARDVVRRLVSYADSARGFSHLSAKLLGGKALGTVMKLRATKLVGAISTALNALDHGGKELPEYQARREELVKAREDLESLDHSVRSARQQKKAMSPEIIAEREAFLVSYTAAKHLVRSILTLKDRLDLLDDVFDDLAEIHKVAGVKDDAPPTPSPAPPPAPSPATPPATSP